VASKKEQMHDRHAALVETLEDLEKDLGAPFTCFTSTKVQILTPEELCAIGDKRAKLGVAMPRILKGAEFQKYAEGLKGKAKQYKKLKGELSSVVAEKGILSRTEDVLKTRHGDQSEFLAKLEKKKGISGAASLQVLHVRARTHTHLHTHTHTHTHIAQLPRALPAIHLIF
jgi:hypothetical protein